MHKPLRTSHPLIKIMNQSLYDLPTPINISVWWNYGSLLGMTLTLQTITGIFLTMHYAPNMDIAFSSIMHITREVEWGWLIRYIHSNGASMFFLFMYLHMSRGLYYMSFNLMETWSVGVIIYILTVATAFMGYVLPWGQMSFWAATVITNMLTTIPYMGKMLTEWLWGGFAIDNPTLNRFFAFHFILPFILMLLSVIHLLFLHQTGSNNPLGINSNSDKIPFHPYHTIKDSIGFIFTFSMLMLLVLFAPNYFNDPENFILSNPSITPIHIKPEWYFLWVYAILRAIPNKLGGVVAAFSAMLIMLTLPFTMIMNLKSVSFYPLMKIMYWTFISTFIILSWIGAQPVEDPYILTGQIFTCLYFMFFILTPLTMFLSDKFTN
nr:TPA: cytochrome b [Bdellodrilus illuminatus]